MFYFCHACEFGHPFHLYCNTRESGYPFFLDFYFRRNDIVVWNPAYTGMTIVDWIPILVVMTFLLLSYPRKRASTCFLWNPAYAGMTKCGVDFHFCWNDIPSSVVPAKAGIHLKEDFYYISKKGIFKLSQVDG